MKWQCLFSICTYKQQWIELEVVYFLTIEVYKVASQLELIHTINSNELLCSQSYIILWNNRLSYRTDLQNNIKIRPQW